jgi:hypothetical protein
MGVVVPPLVARDEKGRVKPGSRLATGNVGRTRMAMLRRTLIKAVSPDKVRQAEAKLFEMFMDGDTTAARIWMDHVLGKPLTQVEVTSRGGQSLTLAFVISAINQAVPDPEVRDRISQVLDQLCDQEQKALDGPPSST